LNARAVAPIARSGPFLPGCGKTIGAFNRTHSYREKKTFNYPILGWRIGIVCP
jgi:hypothetical protein